MKQNTMLTIASLLAIVLFIFHMTGDILFRIEPGGLENYIGVTGIMTVWLCGTVLLPRRWLAHVIMLLGGLLGLGVPYFHMRGRGLAAASWAQSSSAYIFVFTLLALGLCGTFAVILALCGMWGPRSGVPTAETR